MEDVCREPPRSLAAWPAFLWSRVLFPGPSTATGDRPRMAPLLLLIALPALLLYPWIDFRLFEPDESRYAQVPREMLERGDWVVPTLQGEPYLDKPPLVYWLIMLSYRAFGAHDWSARLVPALAVHATIVVTYLLGRRTLGERSARWGALLLAVAPLFVGMARLLLLDGVLTLCVTVALFAAFEAVRGDRLRWGWWMAAAAACGLGLLTKGPVAEVLLIVPLWLYRRLTGRGTSPGLIGWAAFLGVALAIALPWYVALSLRQPEFVSYFFWEHNLQRFFAPGVHVRGVFFYAPILWLLLLPGSLLLVPLGRFLLGGDPEAAGRRSPELGLHLLAGAWCVVFFTLSSCKLPTYILPAAPFLCLVVGHFLAHGPWAATRRPAWLCAGSAALVLFANAAALPWYANYRSPMSRPERVLALCADRSLPVVCYPRNCDSVAFYLGRSDLKAYRSKEIEELRYIVRTQPRTVILCTHRHSLQGLKQLLPPEVRIAREERLGLADDPRVPAWLRAPLARLAGETALGLCDVAVIEMPPLIRDEVAKTD